MVEVLVEEVVGSLGDVGVGGKRCSEELVHTGLSLAESTFDLVDALLKSSLALSEGALGVGLSLLKV